MSDVVFLSQNLGAEPGAATPRGRSLTQQTDTMMMLRRTSLAAFLALPLLAGCESVVLAPSGDIAAQQRDLLVTATLLMLIIIIPVMALTIYFAWKYRAGRNAEYDPDFHHSTGLELVIWAAPLAIIICLGAVTWVGTHLLDPYRPLDRVAEGRPAAAGPLEVEVVAMDWKWLFIYPQYGVATVNELVAPVDRPISFRLTSTEVMNAFYVPALAGMIYAMPGMESRLHAVINYAGTYDGFSANYSGAGFSRMRFKFHGMTEAAFDEWVAEAKAGEGRMDRPRFLDLARPSEAEPVQRFASVDPELFRRIVNRCVEANRMCLDEMAMLDRQGGIGLAGTLNLMPTEGPRAPFGHARFHVATICTPEDSLRAFGAAGTRLSLLDGAAPAASPARPAPARTPAETL